MIPAQYYGIVFLYFIIVLTVVVANNNGEKSFALIERNQDSFNITLVLCVVLALWLGLRPSNQYWLFGDSITYAHSYNLMTDMSVDSISQDGEWIWNNFMFWCSKRIDVSWFFTIISFGYFIFTFIACRILTKNNVLIAMLFVMGAFPFFTFCVNGMRNGLACSIVLIIVALMSVTKKKKNLILALGLSFIASGIHKSTLLPIVCLISSVYLIKSFKQAYCFWLLSIIISLVAGGFVTNLFISLGFDDSRTSYLTTLDEGYFSHTGFRWDFLLYSMMPIVLGYYIVIKRGIRDYAYELLLNTYTLSNAFWVMVIRANYSNRFAYLSWFMYPIVLAYPLLKLDIWGEEQGLYLKRIMLAHVGFTWFMSTFYW